jgi:hypothetical protein
VGGDGQWRSATPPHQATTKSLAFFYLSVWKNEKSAQAFANLYADELGRKYSGIKVDETAARDEEPGEGTMEMVWTTNEGPVVVTQKGKLVFAAESFDLPVARKLAILLIEAQGNRPLQNASLGYPKDQALQNVRASRPVSLTGPLVRFMSNCGVTKAVVDGVLQGTRSMIN